MLTQAGWDRRNSHTALYVQVLQNLGTKYNAPVLDIFTAWQKEPNWNTKYLAKDNLHLSDTGNQAILDAIIKTLAEKLPSAYAPNLPRHWPDMNDINHDNPGAAFNPILAGTESGTSIGSSIGNSNQSAAYLVVNGSQLNGSGNSSQHTSNAGASSSSSNSMQLLVSVLLAVVIMLTA